jgi:hypothetical protein
MKKSNMVCTVQQRRVGLTFMSLRTAAVTCGMSRPMQAVIGETIKGTACSMTVMFEVYTAADFISRAAELS